MFSENYDLPAPQLSLWSCSWYSMNIRNVFYTYYISFYNYQFRNIQWHLSMKKTMTIVIILYRIKILSYHSYNLMLLSCQLSFFFFKEYFRNIPCSREHSQQHITIYDYCSRLSLPGFRAPALTAITNVRSWFLPL